mgnify:CR=1 FL=1
MATAQSPITIHLGHSPDPDDAFMFYGLATGKMDSGIYKFEHILQDIQTLNERATRGELDISAISIHAYSHVCDRYALLRTARKGCGRQRPQARGDIEPLHQMLGPLLPALEEVLERHGASAALQKLKP